MDRHAAFQQEIPVLHSKVGISLAGKKRDNTGQDNHCQ